MLYSMTGYGSSQVLLQGVSYEISIRSVNSKQLDLSLRLPGSLREEEMGIRAFLMPHLYRGKVDVSIRLADSSESKASQLSINTELLKAYYDHFIARFDSVGVPPPVDLTKQIMGYPGVMIDQSNLQLAFSDSDRVALMEAIAAAVEQFDAFRIQEGDSLEQVFLDKVSRIEALLGEVAPYEQSRISEIRAKLIDRLSELSSIQYDAGRLEQEIIYYIEKLDICEEKNRLANHIAYFREVLAQSEGLQDPSKGKKLGFIAQEMGREINTMGSKSNNAPMQQIVVQMKDELEQIKEQVLNVL